MPLYNFATYASYREEWAIEASDIDDARSKIGTDPRGSWLEDALHIDGDTQDRYVFYFGNDGETPEIEEITPDHWAFRAVNRDWIEHSLKQNIAAISGDFHTHPYYAGFHDMFGKHIDGFVGHFEICITMAHALTEWEIESGMGEAYEHAGVPWIEVVESYVKRHPRNRHEVRRNPGPRGNPSRNRRFRGEAGMSATDQPHTRAVGSRADSPHP